MLSIKQAVYEALALGFRRDRQPDPDEETDLVLQEIEEAEKKRWLRPSPGFFPRFVRAFPPSRARRRADFDAGAMERHG